MGKDSKEYRTKSEANRKRILKEIETRYPDLQPKTGRANNSRHFIALLAVGSSIYVNGRCAASTTSCSASRTTLLAIFQ